MIFFSSLKTRGLSALLGRLGENASEEGNRPFLKRRMIKNKCNKILLIRKHISLTLGVLQYIGIGKVFSDQCS